MTKKALLPKSCQEGFDLNQFPCIFILNYLHEKLKTTNFAANI
jgi:hypothetical protein